METIQPNLFTSAVRIEPAGALPQAATPKSPRELAEIVTIAAASADWVDRVRFRADYRWYERLHADDDHDVWLISWLPGQSTGFHDHGESAGAFAVATGSLQEHRAGVEAVDVRPDQVRAFGAHYAHDVRNISTAPAVSIHAYSPKLTEMNEYELEGTELIARANDAAAVDAVEHTSPASEDVRHASRRGVDDLLAAARTRLHRLTPAAAREAWKRGAVLVDIRPEAQRTTEGSIPGAQIIERNVLEWRFDPTSSARLPIARGHGLQVIVFCSEGYTSSFAAAALQDLGLWRATDVIGGFQAWLAAGLPSHQGTQGLR